MTQTTVTKDNFEKTIYLPQKGIRPPWGYIKVDEYNYEADEEALTKLSECFDLLDNGESLNQIMEVMKAAGHPISRSGLHKLWRLKRPVGPREHQKKLKKRREQYREKIKNLPKEEKELRDERKKIADEKRRLANLARIEKQEKELEEKEKKLKELKETNKILKQVNKPAIVNTSENVPEEIIEKVAEKDGREVVFKPNPGPQYEFLAASELEVLYGGAAGGRPKSWFYRLLSA